MTPTKAPEDALVERLLATKFVDFYGDVHAEAADAITTLLERERVLRDALEQIISHRYGDWVEIARAALNPEGVLPD